MRFVIQKMAYGETTKSIPLTGFKRCPIRAFCSPLMTKRKPQVVEIGRLTAGSENENSLCILKTEATKMTRGTRSRSPMKKVKQDPPNGLIDKKVESYKGFKIYKSTDFYMQP